MKQVLENGMVRELEIRAAFDKRDSNSSKKYGVHGVEMCWLLHGPKGVVQFLLYTNWQLPRVQEELNHQVAQDVRSQAQYSEYAISGLLPIAADLGYHSPTPRYEEQMSMECCHIPGGKCYYDGSSMNAEKPWNILREQGEEVLWDFLGDCYHDFFDSTFESDLKAMESKALAVEI